MRIVPIVSTRVMPKAYTSFFVDTVPSAMCSGAIYPLNGQVKMEYNVPFKIKTKENEEKDFMNAL